MIAVTGHFERAKVKTISSKFFSALKTQGLEIKKVGISSKKLKRSGFEIICVVGGDGSLLRVARSVDKTPLLGVAAGTRCCLMQVKEKSIEKAAKKIAKKSYSVEKKARLAGKVSGKKLPLALNELLVAPKKSGSLINLEARFGKRNEKFSCDALIVATPTGSTGHAYSAGGKKIRKDEKKFVVVPSNPLNREGKAFAVGQGTKIYVKNLDKSQALEVVVDGKERFQLKGKLLIEKGKPAELLKLK
ncbi:MAG: NAD(+)/NADH kinase [archaeon]|jgi:NAD+ kinase|nr:NAD(+)/NADH kinase [archaeon]